MLTFDLRMPPPGFVGQSLSLPPTKEAAPTGIRSSGSGFQRRFLLVGLARRVLSDDCRVRCAVYYLP